jgi:phospholipid-translocating ATPase
LYKRGILGLEYTKTEFWLYMLDGLYQSAIVFFIPYLIWSIGLPVSAAGRGVDSLGDFGTTVSVAAIFAANIFVGIHIQ